MRKVPFRIARIDITTERRFVSFSKDLSAKYEIYLEKKTVIRITSQ